MAPSEAYNAGFHWPSRIAHCQLNCRGKDWARTSLRNNGQCGIGDGQCQSANLTPLAFQRRPKLKPSLRDEEAPPLGTQQIWVMTSLNDPPTAVGGIPSVRPN